VTYSHHQQGNFLVKSHTDPQSNETHLKTPEAV